MGVHGSPTAVQHAQARSLPRTASAKTSMFCDDRLNRAKSTITSVPPNSDVVSTLSIADR